MSEEIEVLKAQSNKVAEWASGLVIQCQDDATLAMDGLSRMKKVRAEWVAWWKSPKEKAKAAHAEICAKEKEGTEHIDAAEVVVKGKITAWQNAEQAKALAEQKRLQAIADEQARKEREKAEVAIAVQRAKEAEARRIEAEAIARVQAASNEAERIKAQAEADKAAKAAVTAAEKAEIKTEAAQVVAPLITIESPKIKGTTKTWKAECVDMSKLTGIPVGDIRLTFLEFNQSAADKFAKATTGNVKVEGVRFFEHTGLSVR